MRSELSFLSGLENTPAIPLNSKLEVVLFQETSTGSITKSIDTHHLQIG